MRVSPSAFNSQSSRAVLLFGAAHTHYWRELMPSVLRRAWGEEAAQKADARLAGFAKAQGTVLFFEDAAVVQAMKHKSPAYAAGFDPVRLLPLLSPPLMLA